ncbi:MAG: type II toxin-antitoxin system HicB family antitoxin [Chloroflexi bacterium]|nr:type II toxin-antitoxin system HicB family antitoxin [Chloroflexota bacterium]
MAATYKLPLVLDPQPEGGYTVTCPLLPELITEGDTVQEALNNASDALTAVIEAYQDLGKPIPAVLQHAIVSAYPRQRHLAGRGLQ